ncbi:type II toxin-antitoxin system RelE/ParE family toxin [Leucothrix pacifica]|uniref:Type II toxin-antitoxin system RelE/ParE family toxin n=1 Tax=Leucothrix pacifica TaxID=1247513 RepID=A0A317CA03_9GAMM|nr:type II toxin-antitoxin system RelE/ParE family toxin [Leucothrix pacifica]PWQ95378.1 hypothetical protein DKW60_14955 [Leucothrix pacifica]
MRYVLHPEAYEDIENTVDFYDGRVAGLGAQFIDQLESDLLKVADAPEQFFCAYPKTKVYRYPMKRFPYSIFYRIDASYVTVITVVHQAREPLQWLDRLDPSQK